MATTQEPSLDEIQWKAPPIAQSMGGIQTNTVLPYFYHSPFFDATSNNATITTQATHNPALFYLIQTREAFEGRLRTMQGLEFMVAHDPSENGTKTENSGVWIIRKQNRRKRAGAEDEITPISSYYVVGENVYMAPSLGRVLAARLLSTVSSLNKVMATASELSTFTPALGHTYLSPASKPLVSNLNNQPSQTSKESTPMPEIQDAASTRAQSDSRTFMDHDFQSPQMLQESLNLSLQYDHEYMDETPLVGEPGSFKITKARENQQRAPQSKPKPAAVPAKPSTPQIKTDVPNLKQEDRMDAEKNLTSAVTKEKKARRKSKPAGSTTTPK
ncbi:MAG: hypothetical protein Q9201_007643 [Fulgogasparrea decipioides]